MLLCGASRLGLPIMARDQQARITELASLCGAYVTGAAAHWRTMERASCRDVFLRYHDAVPSRLYNAACNVAAQVSTPP